VPESPPQPRIAHVIGAIAPYTNRLYEAVGKRFPGRFHVIACTDTEPTRGWNVPEAVNYNRIVLPGYRKHLNDLHSFYLNPAVIQVLRAVDPGIVVLGSLSPTGVIAGLYALATGRILGVSTDGVMETDPGVHSLLYRIPRKLLMPRASLGFGACEASLRLLEHFGLKQGYGTVYPLVPAWERQRPVRGFAERPYDLVFCGRIDERKGVPFLITVLEALKARGVSPSLRVAGEGPLQGALEEAAHMLGLTARFDGYTQTEQLEEVFSSGKLFVFPSQFDPWGLVTNEALQCGTPVIGSPHATSVRELVAPNGAGAMLPLDPALWAERIAALLDQQDEWAKAQAHALAVAEEFSLDKGVDRMVAAYEAALARKRA